MSEAKRQATTGRRAAWWLALWALAASMAGCPAEEASNGGDVAAACNESDLIAQCPPGTDPLLGSQAEMECGGVGGVDIVNASGEVSGRCLGSGACVVACRFLEPCPCGVTAITRDGVFCSSCQNSAACGNGICEGGEDPEACPEDCGRQCATGAQRCAGDTEYEVCDGRGRWERVPCASGEICQGPIDGTVFCRRDDVLIGVDPGEDPNRDPEQSERYEVFEGLTETGSAVGVGDGRELTWEASLTVPGSQDALLVTPTDGGLWIWRPSGGALLNMSGEVVEQADYEGGAIASWSVAADASGGRLFFMDRAEEAPGRPLVLWDGAAYQEVGTSQAYQLLGGGTGTRPVALSASGGVAAAILTHYYRYAPDPRYPNDRRTVVVEHLVWTADLSGDAPVVRAMAAAPSGAQHVELSPNGRVMALVRQRFNGTLNAGGAWVELWDTERSTLLARLLPLDDDQPEAALFSPDGALLAVTTGQGVEIWDITLGALLATLPTRASLAELAWSPDGATFFVGARRFEARTGVALTDLPDPDVAPTAALSGLRFGPDGRLITWRRAANALEVAIYAP